MNACPALLAGAPGLCDWVLDGGRAERAPSAWRWRLRWHARWSRVLQAQQRQRGGAARPQQTPLFVLGLWRSGTTLLHERLSALPGLQSPLTWQCFNPASFLLTGAPTGPARAVQRPMDDGEVRPDSAQEDEFALLLQGAPSLYRGFIDPRRLGELATTMFAPMAPGRPPIGDAWADDWLRFLAGVERQGGGHRVVLKSPNHTLRWPALANLFPQAPRIWIGCPLEQVWHSNLRMWRAMFDTYALWTCPPGVLEAFLQRCIAQYLAALEQALAETGPPPLWVDFEDLFAQPLPLLRALADFAAVDAEVCPEWVLADVVQRLPARPPRTAAAALPPATLPLAQAVDRLHAQARQRWHWQQRAAA